MKLRSSPSAVDPLLPFAFRFVPMAARGKGAPGRAGACDARRSPQVATALRCSVAWPCRPTRFAHCVRCAQTDGGKSDHDARCARGPHALRFSAPCHARPSPPGHTFARVTVVRSTRSSIVAARQAQPGLRPVGGGEQRRSGVGARSALCCLTRRRLSERSERSERSELGDATPFRAAQRSRSEAETATAWPQPRLRLPRLAQPSARSGRRSSATGRKQTSNPQRFMHRGSREAQWSN